MIKHQTQILRVYGQRRWRRRPRQVSAVVDDPLHPIKFIPDSDMLVPYPKGYSIL